MYEITQKDIYTIIDAAVSARILSNTFDSLFYENADSVDKLANLSEILPLALRILGVKYTKDNGDLIEDVLDDAKEILDRNIAEYGHSRKDMFQISEKICEELKEMVRE